MPRLVDHDERKREIVAATWRVIARGGLAHTTIREIAKESGCSSGALAHYFVSREDILAAALVTAHRGVRDRTDGVITKQGLRGLDALRVLMLESLPLNRQGMLEAQIEVCFWGEAVGNAALKRIQNHEVDGFCARIRHLLVQAEADGNLAHQVSVTAAVHQCHILVDGLSVQAVLYPERAKRKEQIRQLDALLDRFQPPSPGRRSDRADEAGPRMNGRHRTRQVTRS